MFWGRTIVKWTMLAANLMAALLLVGALLSSHISPDKVIYLAYLNLIFPLIIITNVAFVVFWAFLRKWYFLISATLLVFSIKQINVTFPLNLGTSDNKTEVNKSITILTYNTRMCGSVKKPLKNKPNKVLKYIKDTNADIVCLQEFTTYKNDNYLTGKDIDSLFRNYRYKYIYYKIETRYERLGVAIFSKYPIINKKAINYRSNSNSSVYADIKVGDQIIRVFNNHLESNRITENDKEMAKSLKNNLDAHNISGVTIHFSRKLATAYRLRAKQVDMVRDEIKKSPYKMIVCGDFNDVPTSYAYTQIKGNLLDAFTEKGTGFGWTFYDRFYHFRIDYILYDATFSPLQYKMDKVKYSDHYPVFCKMKIR